MLIKNSHGIVTHEGSPARRTDFLYRISLKCLIRNEKGEILVVKEAGRDWWDLPGGGMDHGENIASAIAREMKEEVTLKAVLRKKSLLLMSLLILALIIFVNYA